MLVQRRKNKDPWSGTVVSIDRCSAQDSDGNAGTCTSIRYRRDDNGQVRSYDVDASSYGFFFDGLQPGDRLVKPAGDRVPQRVAAAGK